MRPAPMQNRDTQEGAWWTMEVLLQCAGGPVKQVAGGVCDGQ